MMANGIGLYGGSFDPIHLGHLIIARCVAEQLDLERVILLPAADPPHKPDQALADPVHRRRMVELAIEKEPYLEVNDYDLLRSGPTYSIDTVIHFRQQFGDQTELYWIIGADSLAELATWHRAGELVDMCHIATAVRPGWHSVMWETLSGTFSKQQISSLRRGALQTPSIDISSTDIRGRVREGRTIRYLLPDTVLDYIETNRLYRS